MLKNLITRGSHEWPQLLSFHLYVSYMVEITLDIEFYILILEVNTILQCYNLNSVLYSSKSYGYNLFKNTYTTDIYCPIFLSWVVISVLMYKTLL